MEAVKQHVSERFRHIQLNDKDENIFNTIHDFLNNAQPEKAMDFLLAELSKNMDNSAFLYCQLGVVQCVLDELQAAEKSFLKSIELDPEIIEGYFNLGLLYHQLEQYEYALTYYKKVILNNDKDTDTLELMGECCQELSNHKDAIAFYDAAFKNNPQSLNAAVNLAHLYLQTDKNQDAINVLKIALVTHSDQKELHFALGDIYKSQGELEHAIGHFRKVISLDAENARAFYELGYCCFHLQLTNQAIPLLAKAYKLDTHNADSLYYLAKAYEIKKLKDSAVPVYEKWVEIEIQHIDTMSEEIKIRFNNVCIYLANHYKSSQNEEVSKHFESLLVTTADGKEISDHSKENDATSLTIDD